ncbi:MAG: DUF4434 domain-containing protein [Clostridia bacterium]|nr:DUF4434 domain-containing protein [Clostridia bacterium]
MERINKNTRYFYSYPTLTIAKNDKYGDKLTFGGQWVKVEIKNHTDYRKNWSGVPVACPDFDEYVDSHMYFQNDWGLCTEVEKVTLKFSKLDLLPERIELFFTDDGYNYTLYPKVKEGKSETTNEITYEFTLEKPLNAKGVRVMIFAEMDKEMRISDFCVFGKKNKNEIKLLSKDLPYEWQGGNSTVITTQKNLTDGVVGKYDEIEKFEAKTVNQEHPISRSQVSVITIDLQEVKNVCEVSVDAICTKEFNSRAKYISVEYSVDRFWYDAFAQGYQCFDFGNEDAYTSRYIAMRNHTVKARYIRIYVTGDAALSQFSVYGTDKEIKEPKYDHFDRKELIPHTDVMEGKPVIINGEESTKLTDGLFTCYEEDIEEKENVILCDFGEVKEEINSIMLYFIRKNGFALPEGVETYLSEDGKNFQLMEGEYKEHTIGFYQVRRLYFKNQKARYAKFVIKGDRRMAILQLAVYNKQPQLPLYRGGYLQIHLLKGNMEHAVIKNDDYMWYIHLKGMKDIGMDQVVLQHGGFYGNQLLSMKSPRLEAKGYRLGYGYGSYDPYTACMEAAEKLNMHVYVGTSGVHGRYWTNLDYAGPDDKGGLKMIKEFLVDAEDYIHDIYDKYDKYKAFKGYYHSEETCDEWMCGKYATEMYRLLYGTMTNFVRKYDKKRKTMASPALFRTCSPAQGEKAIYDMIRPEKEGERPLIDIIAAQDCLGREPKCYVTPQGYNDFEEHLEAFVRGIKRAGAEYWNDAEIFEQIYRTKRDIDNVHTMEVEAKYSNCTIVFDYPHYFCDWTKGNPNISTVFNTAYITTRYAKRYNEQFKELDKIGME